MSLIKIVAHRCVLVAGAFVLFTAFSTTVKPTKIKPVKKVSIKVKEPSDICLSPSGNSFYVVSDNGILHELDIEGKIIRTAKATGYDFEGVHSDENFVYVVDEMARKIHLYNHKDLSLVRSVSVPYMGGLNQAYESITYNKSKNCLILVTEYNPTWIFELDSEFRVKNEIKFDKARDISAATWHNGFLWFLSDEDRTVFKINPDTYEVLASWIVPVINPEGIVFDKNGQLIIASDDLEKLFYFNNPENVQK